jgi:hypothetical protein
VEKKEERYERARMKGNVITITTVP